MPYALQRLWHGCPVLCPAGALLTHIPLGPRPWLHQLRSRLPGFVRRLHSYYGGGRLLTIVHHPLRLLPLPTPTSAKSMWRRPTLRAPRSPAKNLPPRPRLRPPPGVLWAAPQPPPPVPF